MKLDPILPGDVLICLAPDGSYFVDVARAVTVQEQPGGLSADGTAYPPKLVSVVVLTTRSNALTEDCYRIPAEFSARCGRKILAALADEADVVSEAIWNRAYFAAQAKGETYTTAGKIADKALALHRERVPGDAIQQALARLR